jgi:DNA repair protein RadC
MTERYRLALVREPAGAPFGTQIWAPSDLATVARTLICDEPQEIVLCLHLDQRHRLRGYQEVARGGVAAAQVDLQILFGSVLLTAAPAFALAHNTRAAKPHRAPTTSLLRGVSQGRPIFSASSSSTTSSSPP